MPRTGRPRSERAMFSQGFIKAIQLVSRNYEFDHIEKVTWGAIDKEMLQVLVTVVTDSCVVGTIEVQVGFFEGEDLMMDKGYIK